MAQITEDYVSFETAKLLKEKWFDENTPINYFIGDDKPRGCVVGEMIYHKRAEEDTHLIACPTLQMAMRWLREEKDIFIMIKPYPNEDGFAYAYEIKRLIGGNDFTTRSVRPENNRAGYDSYEDAVEAAIKYCLKNLI